MTEQKYIITGKKLKGQITLGYRADGKIQSVEIQADLTEDQTTWLWKHLPSDLAALEAFKTKHTTVLVVPVPTDLSFDNFWNTYNYKVGKKKQTENSWNKLSEEKRTLALVKIPAYNRFLSSRTTEKAYPSTYLNQEYYENDY